MGDAIMLNNGEQLYLCDYNGRTVGIFLSPAKLGQMDAERERLAKEVEELKKKLDEAQHQITLLEEDWRSMFRLLPKELQVTEEDIREIQRNPHTFEDLFREWEQK